PVSVGNRVVLPAPLGPIRAAIIPSSSVRSTRLSACNPPNRLLTPRSSSNAISVAPLPRRQDTLWSKRHHKNQNQTENHPLILRRFNLGWNLTQIKLAQKWNRQHDP